MKSNNKMVALALVLAALTVGVGFAAITTVNLNISGKAQATADASNFKVEFFGTPTSSDSSKLTVGIDATDKKKATIGVSGLTAKGDTVTATYTVKNLSADLSANLAATVSKNTNTEYFTVEPTVTAANIAAGKDTTVTVKVTLKLL